MNSSSSPPSPEHQSIFGDTYRGVPNPQIPHTHPYPTRFHGPNYNVPWFGLPYRDQSWQRPPYLPTPPGPCYPGSDCGSRGFGDVSANATIDLTSVDVSNASKSADKMALPKLAIAAFGRRAGGTLPPAISAWLMAGVLVSVPVRLATIAALVAISYERAKDYGSAASQLATAIQTLDVYRNTITGSANRAAHPSTALRLLFSQWLLEDQAGGPKVVAAPLIPLTRVKATGLKLTPTLTRVKATGMRLVPTPGGGSAQIPFEAEPEESFPWLYVLGGVAVVGAVGYTAWKRKH